MAYFSIWACSCSEYISWSGSEKWKNIGLFQSHLKILGGERLKILKKGLLFLELEQSEHNITQPASSPHYYEDFVITMHFHNYRSITKQLWKTKSLVIEEQQLVNNSLISL